MNRRSLLAGTAGCLAGLLAGCSGTEPNGNGTTPSTETPTPGETTFRVVDAYCRSSPGGASVSFGDGSVTIHGRVEAPNGCYTAVLDSVQWEDETLVVRVESAQRDVDACVQCLYAIEYEASVRFEGDGPARVDVIHDGDRVASVTR